jgi:hypothetical protein
MSIFGDIKTELEADAGISAIVGNRVKWRNPTRIPSGSYITLNRQGKERDIANQADKIRMICYSKDMVELESLTDQIISFLEGKTYLNGNNYYMISLLNQTDGDEKLKEGFYWSMLTFQFNTVT